MITLDMTADERQILLDTLKDSIALLVDKLVDELEEYDGMTDITKRKFSSMAKLHAMLLDMDDVDEALGALALHLRLADLIRGAASYSEVLTDDFHDITVTVHGVEYRVAAASLPSDAYDKLADHFSTLLK